MDKRISLKREKNKRACKKEIPDLSHEDTIRYLKGFFIEDKNENMDIKNLISSEIKKKLDSYKRQDIKKNKYNHDVFISLDECYSKLLTSNMNCYYCKNEMVLLYNFSRQENQWTLERLNNSIGHSNDNTVVSCLDCNLKRGTRNSDSFQFAKQLVIKKV